jgi:hypothetical protein
MYIGLVKILVCLFDHIGTLLTDHVDRVLNPTIWDNGYN